MGKLQLMSPVPHSEKFKKLLRTRLVSYGIAEETAETISQKIVPLRKEESLIFAECNDTFYHKNVLNRMLPQINSVARECWGEDASLLFQQQPSSTNSVPKRGTKTRRRRTSIVPTPHESLFSWEPDEKEKTLELAPAVQPQPSKEREAELPQKSNPAGTPKPNRVSEPSSTSSHRSGAQSGHSEGLSGNLQRDFLFETFVRGQSNMVAYSACETVARNPGELSNPVFVYGSTGLGKTHLLHAVGNEILSNHNSWKIVYVSSQDFMNELITSIRFNKTGEFRAKYHSADVLLVDDIQFLESKESTQLEFFHIFNVLCEKRKQIVITSDKYPKDIPNIEERLKSRFLQGLISDIEPPSYEDRVAIIEAKAKMMNLDLSQEIIMHIASNVRSNVREIQGLLTNLLMNQSMTGQSATLDTTNDVLRRIVNMRGPSIDVSTIQRVVAQHFGLKVSDLTSPKREKRLVLPRHIAMYLTKTLMNIALKEIAESFHRGDHTTVQHAIKKVTSLISTDESTRASIKELKRKLEQSI